MKRTIILAFIFLFSCALIWSETIYLKSGEKVTGEIKNETDSSWFVQTQSGILEILKTNVDRIGEPDFSAPAQTAAPEVIPQKKHAPFSINDYKNDTYYLAYRHYLGMGLGFFIPGMVFTFTPLIFTPFVVEYFVNSHSWDYYGGGIYGVAVYSSFIGIGLILDIISIPLFCVANSYYQKVMEKYRVAVDVKEDNLEISMNIAF